MDLFRGKRKVFMSHCSDPLHKRELLKNSTKMHYKFSVGVQVITEFSFLEWKHKAVFEISL